MSILSATSRLRQKVLGYPVDIVDRQLSVEIIEESWHAKRPLHVVTLNAEMVIQAQGDPMLDRIVRHAHLIVPDGSGVVFALRLHGEKVHKLAGIDLAYSALSEAAKLGKKVALVGGKREILEKLLQVLPEQHPGLKIVASHHGYFSSDDEEQVVDSLTAEAPDLVLVALGVPKQEYFIDKWQSQFEKAVLIGVGGSFDVWTGSVKRAPQAFQKFHLEWLYRLIAEPWRFKRMSSTLPNFALQVLKDAATRKLVSKTAHGTRRKSGRQGKSHDKSREKSKDR